MNRNRICSRIIDSSVTRPYRNPSELGIVLRTCDRRRVQSGIHHSKSSTLVGVVVAVATWPRSRPGWGRSQMSAIQLLRLLTCPRDGRGRLQHLLHLEGIVPVDEEFDTVVESVDSVLQIGHAVVDLWLPSIEVSLCHLHLRYGGLEISDPLGILAQESEDLPELLLLSHHKLLASEVLVVVAAGWSLCW